MFHRVRAAVCIASVVVSAFAGAACAQTPQAGTALQITLDADAVAIVRAWRRQQGLDPPDPAADRYVAALLARAASASPAGQPARPAPQQAARANP